MTVWIVTQTQSDGWTYVDRVFRTEDDAVRYVKETYVPDPDYWDEDMEFHNFIDMQFDRIQIHGAGVK